MSSSPPPYETEDRQVLDGGERGASKDASAVKDNKQVDAVSVNKETDACTSEKRDAVMIHKNRDVILIGFNWLQNTAGDTNNTNIFCFIVGFIIIIFGIWFCFYPISPPPVGQIEVNGGNITHDLQHLEQFVLNGAINGSIVQDPKRQVYPGTREEVLSQIQDWIDDPDLAEPILWLHGPTGVGKSAIVQAITDSYTTEKVAANFFFSRSDPDRNNGYRLFTTLAWQFISSIPGIKDHIARSLSEQPDLPTKNLEIQFQELIVRPFEHAHQLQLSDKIVIIDAIDECVGADLQERILKLIGDVATNPRIPLRFLISSRPENHINEIITSFQHHVLFIDLADCDDADSDIEKYFKGNFERIAKGQGIDPTTWPNAEMMQNLVYKASGQFQYASTVIKFVSDEDHLAKAQLDIILGLKAYKARQPFAELDSLYIEILERMSDKEFLKTFLAHLVAKYWIDTGFHPAYFRTEAFINSFCYYPHLRDDLGILMDLSEQELRIKLRKMRSLLDITPDYVGLHHMSFLEFLQDPSRSGQYHISKKNAARQYLMLVIDSVVRSANESLRMIEHPDNYPPVPKIAVQFRSYSSNFHYMLSREEWQEALRPLEKFQDRLLNLPNFTIPRNECTIFHVVHRLQLSISYHQFFLSEPKEDHGAILPFALIRNLHANFSSSLTRFGMLKEMFYLMNTLRHVNPEMIAMRVRSWSELQNLMELVYHIVNGKHFITKLFSADVARKATQLAADLYIRVPILPHIFSTTFIVDPHSGSKKGRPLYTGQEDFRMASQMWFISKFLDHGYIFPVLWIKIDFKHDGFDINGFTNNDSIGIPIRRWRTSTDPNPNEILFAMLKLARAIQYLDSMGIMFSDSFGLDDIYVDSRFRVRISSTELVWPMYGRFFQNAKKRYENNVAKFGELFFMIYFDIKLSYTTGTGTETYQLESGVDVRVLQLIERCLCAKDKPSIDEVVEEMESWTVGPNEKFLGWDWLTSVWRGISDSDQNCRPCM